MVNSEAVDSVVVAMSGGVDSSVAALLLHERGYDAIGVSMQVWDYSGKGGSGSRQSCCSPADFLDARRVAARIGIPYYVFDFEESFRREVIDRFRASYERGLTPNPCVDCNQKVKFRDLRERAKKLGVQKVATGHYARVVQDAAGYRLLRGRDRTKDQTYFLYGLRPDELRETLFPVGELTKGEVREVAARHGLSTADKPESQDICFVAGAVGDFLVSIGTRRREGAIVRKSGEVVGTHDGIQGFTVGQRRGLGVGGSSEPLYVLELDVTSNQVIVGPKDDLERESFSVEELSFVGPALCRMLDDRQGEIVEFPAIAQLRHRHPGVQVTVRVAANREEAVVSFGGEWTTVSPGQAAVFYDLSNEEVLGGGRIAKR